MGKFTADFETTTNPNDCRVWAYAICEIDNPDNTIIGLTIDEFMKWCESEKENHTIYFHNLKFDSQFIMYWLFKNGFRHITEDDLRESKTFSTVISDKGMYYQIEVIFNRKGKKIKRVIFQDSLKLVPLSVDAIAKSFKLPIQKLEIDYKAHNNLPAGSPLSKEEEEYLKHDVKIVAYALNYFFSQGLTKMTIGSCALNEYKTLIDKRKFERFFPTPRYHEDVKQSYRGGFTYLNPKFAGKVVGEGVVFDVNSLYPSVMMFDLLPFSTPIFFKGKYEEDLLYPLYTQMFRCEFELKKGKIPTIQIKGSSIFRGNEYLTSSNGDEVVLCLNSVDLKLFFEQYNVYNIEYLSGWKFKATHGLFEEYINKWSNMKIQSKKDGNHGMYLISKLFLNSLYGKFGTDTKMVEKIPYLGDDDVIHFMNSPEKVKDGIYIAVASFITSYARLKTISSAQKVMDNYNQGLSNIQFIYADTDSLHLLSPNHEIPDYLDIDPTRLGAWKYESKFDKAKFLRQKCYIENSTEDVDNPNPDYEMKVTCAGMPKSCHKEVTFKNFKIGATFKGKLQPKIVKGGVILADVDFTIKKI